MTKTYTFDLDLISDLHKDAYGFRPSQSFWACLAAADADQKQLIWDYLLESLEATIVRERQAESRAVKDFEQRIASLLSLGAKDFQMAVKWLHEAYETAGDDEYLEFMLGLPFGHIRKARCDADVVTV